MERDREVMFYGLEINFNRERITKRRPYFG